MPVRDNNIKMKLSTAIVVLSSLSGICIASARMSADAKIAQASKKRELQDMELASNACFSDVDFTVYFKGKCDFDSLVERMSLKVAENERCVNSGKEEVMLLVGEFE